MNNAPEGIKMSGDGAASPADREMEAGLRRALLPEDPPLGFADRVMARAGLGPGSALTSNVPPETAPKTGEVVSWPARRWVGWAVAAVLLLGCFEGGEAWRHVREQQRRVAAATAQFETTERVTVRALAQAKEQLQRAGVPLTLD